MVGVQTGRLWVLGFLALVTPASEAQRVEWTTSVDAPPRLFAAPRPIATDAIGNVFVVGEGYDGTTFFIVTAKLAPSGVEVWRTMLVSSFAIHARAITTDPAGNVYVAASLVHVDGPGLAGANYLTVKYDRDGREAWRRSANTSPVMYAAPYAIATDDGGNVYVTGTSNDAAYSGDFFTLKYAPDGTELWRAVTDGGSKLGDIAHAIAIDVAGSVYVVGVSFYSYDPFEGSNSFGLLIKYDSAGTRQWLAGIDGGGGLGNGVDVATDAAGNVFMVATSTTGLAPLFQVPYLQLGKFDAEGNQLWSVDATGPVAGLVGEGSRAHALAVDGLGNAYVTGEYWQALGINTRTTFITLKYSPGGAEQWRAIDSANLSPYGNMGNFAAGLVVNGSDDVIVTGQRATGGPGTTMKHGVGGQVLWRVEQPTFTPSAIVRGPADSVYVAGPTASGLVVQKVAYGSAAATAAMVPATSREGLIVLSLAVIVAAACRRRGTRAVR